MASSVSRSLSTKLTLTPKHPRPIVRNYHRAADLKMSGILFFALHLRCRGLKLIARHFFGGRCRGTLPKKFCNPPLTPPLLRQASTRTPSGVSPRQTSNGIEQASALYHSHPDSPGAGGLQAQSQSILPSFFGMFSLSSRSLHTSTAGLSYSAKTANSNSTTKLF